MTALAGMGLYTLSQASSLIGVEAKTIGRWLFGRAKTKKLWTPEPALVGVAEAISFNDMLELRVVYELHKEGISLQAIRLAIQCCEEILGKYPLISPSICTDGKNVFLRALESDENNDALIDLGRKQNTICEVIIPSLKKGVIYEKNKAARWLPDPDDNQILIDPQISFGKPIVLPSKMPVAVLVSSFAEENENYETVARLYGVSVDEVRRAIIFNKRMSEGALLC